MTDDLFRDLDGALAPNTLRAYRSDFRRFERWCQRAAVDPLAASGEHVAAFVEDSIDHRSAATIRRGVASLSTLFTLNGYPDPTRTPPVKLALKRMYRRLGRAQKQAYPLTRDLLEQLLAACRDDVLGERDRVLLLLGYETMRRRAELCALRFEDLEQLPKGKRALRLRFSKTDQYGKGRLLPVSDRLYRALATWGERVGHAGTILRSVDRYGHIRGPLPPSGINRRLRALQAAAKLDIDGQLSGHSFRVGAALDLLEAGEPLVKIMLRGGWSSETTAIKYLREWQEV